MSRRSRRTRRTCVFFFAILAQRQQARIDREPISSVVQRNWRQRFVVTGASTRFRVFIIQKVQHFVRRRGSQTLLFAGYTYLFHVDNGTTFRNSYAADGSSLHYETVAGAGAGSAETVHLHVAELAPGLYFVSWVEASGMAVSHAMNLNTNTVYAFWSWQGEAGRQGELHTGKLEQVS